MEKSQINNEELLREFKELKERLQLKIENEMDQIKSDQHSSIARMQEQLGIQITGTRLELSQEIVQQVSQFNEMVIDAKKELQSQTAQLDHLLSMRQGEVEQQLSRNVDQLTMIQDIANVIESKQQEEYKEFVRERRKWKSDFESAGAQQLKTVYRLERLVEACLDKS